MKPGNIFNAVLGHLAFIRIYSPLPKNVNMAAEQTSEVRTTPVPLRNVVIHHNQEDHESSSP
jgi:hypothetical protein